LKEFELLFTQNFCRGLSIQEKLSNLLNVLGGDLFMAVGLGQNACRGEELNCKPATHKKKKKKVKKNFKKATTEKMSVTEVMSSLQQQREC
jgi:hypothetical protein